METVRFRTATPFWGELDESESDESESEDDDDEAALLLRFLTRFLGGFAVAGAIVLSWVKETRSWIGKGGDRPKA